MNRVEKFGFVYIWRDKKRNMYYIGCHWGTENDGYVCSSTRMRNVYNRRKEDFKRRIISRVYTNRQDLLTEEHKWLSQIKDEELGKKFYNMSKKHFGHWSSIPDEERRLSISEKISKRTKEAMSRPEVREKTQKQYDNIRGKSQSVSLIEKRRESMKKTMAEKFPIEQRSGFGKPEFGSEEYRDNMTKSVSESWNNRDKVSIGSKISKSLTNSKELRSKKISSLRWYNDGSINRRLQDHPGPGWTTGRIKLCQVIFTSEIRMQETSKIS